MMPQKKNPDVPELVRGKAGRVFGHLQALLTIMKGLPLAYNRDLQEDKIPLFDTVDTVKMSVRIMGEVIHGMKVRKDRMLTAAQDGFMNATDLADYLVDAGHSFSRCPWDLGSNRATLRGEGVSNRRAIIEGAEGFFKKNRARHL